ncbi:transcription factor HES-2 [Sarcophilus harrisii]|uniref:Hes family bHLH transcription factor 2 n=1 Tax=Sarcophilus harrisii TaxID=9305 RepID=A0A7N4V1W5_SARHA|nr:transcription factor HES-2 [Sarcophilus harrisii]
MSPHGAEPEAGSAFQPKMGVPRRPGDAAELRKTLKPLMEKRRRARINESLSQLKGLILPLIGKDSSRYSKLEKADILEMTVRFLQELPTSHGPAAPTLADSYREGYRACLSRLTRVLPSCSLLDGEVCSRLLEHLHRSAAGQSLPPDSRSSPKDLRSDSPDRMRLVCSPRGSGGCPPGPPPSGLWRPW